MIFMKLPYFKSLDRPMDNGLRLRDGKRLFGDHKTWKGFLSYIVFAAIWTTVSGLLISLSPGLEAHNYLYVNNDNTVLYNAGIGAALGLAYAVFELPNSYMKRRLGIEPGETTHSLSRYVFIWLDQTDSVIGCVLVLLLVFPMSLAFFLAYIFLGSAMHLFINALLKITGLRKAPR